MDDLIKLIIKHKGRSTDYRIEVKGIKVLPPGVKLKITHLVSHDNVELVVP